MAISDNDLPGNDGLDVYALMSDKPVLRLVFLRAAKAEAGQREVLGWPLDDLSKKLAEQSAQDIAFDKLKMPGSVAIFYPIPDSDLNPNLGKFTGAQLQQDFSSVLGGDVVDMVASKPLQKHDLTMLLAQAAGCLSYPSHVRCAVFIVNGSDDRDVLLRYVGGLAPQMGLVEDMSDALGVVLDFYEAPKGTLGDEPFAKVFKVAPSKTYADHGLILRVERVSKVIGLNPAFEEDFSYD